MGKRQASKPVSNPDTRPRLVKQQSKAEKEAVLLARQKTHRFQWRARLIADAEHIKQLSLDSGFTVTRQWILDNRTPSGGWYAKQLHVIGVSWPPVKGWLDRVDGLSITPALKTKFENFIVRTPA